MRVTRHGQFSLNSSSNQTIRNSETVQGTKYFIRQEIRAENARKEKDWELTKNQLEEKMKADMERMKWKKEKEKGSVSETSNSCSPPSNTKRWIDTVEEEEDHQVLEDNGKDTSQNRQGFILLL